MIEEGNWKEVVQVDRGSGDKSTWYIKRSAAKTVLQKFVAGTLFEAADDLQDVMGEAVIDDKVEVSVGNK